MPSRPAGPSRSSARSRRAGSTVDAAGGTSSSSAKSRSRPGITSRVVTPDAFSDKDMDCGRCTPSSQTIRCRSTCAARRLVASSNAAGVETSLFSARFPTPRRRCSGADGPDEQRDSETREEIPGGRGREPARVLRAREQQHDRARVAASRNVQASDRDGVGEASHVRHARREDVRHEPEEAHVAPGDGFRAWKQLEPRARSARVLPERSTETARVGRS